MYKLLGCSWFALASLVLGAQDHKPVASYDLSAQVLFSFSFGHIDVYNDSLELVFGSELLHGLGLSGMDTLRIWKTDSSYHELYLNGDYDERLDYRWEKGVAFLEAYTVHPVSAVRKSKAKHAREGFSSSAALATDLFWKLAASPPREFLFSGNTYTLVRGEEHRRKGRSELELRIESVDFEPGDRVHLDRPIVLIREDGLLTAVKTAATLYPSGITVKASAELSSYQGRPR